MSDLEREGQAHQSPCFSAHPLVRTSGKQPVLPGMMSQNPEKGTLLPSPNPHLPTSPLFPQILPGLPTLTVEEEALVTLACLFQHDSTWACTGEELGLHVRAACHGCGGKCEDRDAEASKPRGPKESEGWRKPTFGSEICAPIRQVVDPFPGHAKPVFPAEVVVARRRNSDTSTTQYQPLFHLTLSGSLGPLGFQATKGWLGPSISLQRETNKAIELKWAKNNGYAKEPSSLWAGAHTLGRDRTYWCLCLLTTHVRMVARSWSCMGAEPTAMLKTMLSTGSKVANSSLVGAAPAIKYHWPRWGSGNWRDKEGSRRRWVSLQNPTSSSVRMTILRNEGVGCLFPAKDWIHDKESLNDFSSLLLFSKPHSPVLHVFKLMAIVLIYMFYLLLSSSQHSHPFFLPVWLSGHAGPLTLVHQSPPPPTQQLHICSVHTSFPSTPSVVSWLCSGHW